LKGVSFKSESSFAYGAAMLLLSESRLGSEDGGGKLISIGWYSIASGSVLKVIGETPLSS